MIDPRLADCRRLFLRDHVLPLSIGVHAHEKRAPQRVLINVDVWVPLAHTTPRRDAIEEVFDYDLIRRAIAGCVARGHIELQETLADELLATLLAHPLVRAARVSTEKPDVYPDCTSVGVEVFAFRTEPEGPAKA